ncbi:MAG TPA: GMC family oxidoreductase N-terminal domain-containing protein [Phototrophicaceae bacterium]|nr:GMC family oxidoreductase N-terminal domain-containing protein [Phototrophicaceae bacterium]
MERWQDYTLQEVRLAQVLKGTAIFFIVLSLLTLGLPYFLRTSPLFTAPPFFVTNTIAGLALLAVLSWLAAADVRRFRAMIYVVVGGLLIGATACLAADLHPATAPQWTLPLLLGFAVCMMLALLLAGVTARTPIAAAPWQPWLPDKPLSGWERFTQVLFGLFGLGSLIAAAGSILAPYLGSPFPASFLANPLMVAGSAIKIGLLGLCALLVAAEVRRFTHHTQMITVLIVGHSLSFIVIVLTWIFGFDRFGAYALTSAGMSVSRDQMMFGACALDVVIIGGFLFLSQRINHVLLDYLGFLSPTQFRALEATAETLIAGETAERVQPHEIVLNTDSYLKNFRSDRLFLAKLAVSGLELMPLVWLQPPITYLHPAARQDFINTRFKKETLTPSRLYRLLDGLVHGVNTLLLRLRGRSSEEAGAALSFTGLLEAMLRFNMQLTYLGYYNHPAVWPKKPDGSGLGYVPFSQRPKDFNVTPRRPHPPLTVTTPATLERQGLDVINDADVVIIGSGAAGSILAEQLADQGRRVLLLEKGLYIHPDDFKEDEIDMISRLYSDGALQISQSLRFTVLQGSCVGGTTVVNNAVCFDTPRRVLDIWNNRNTSPVLDAEKFYKSQKAVRDRLHIQRINAGTRHPLDTVLNHGDGVLNAAMQTYFQNRANGYKYDVIEANILDCLGCGYCNIGCKYGRKLSMLDEVLPAAQHKHGAENFRIISEANVVRLTESGGKITEIVARIQGKRQLIIKNPKTVIVSGGTIQSSWLLMQSGIGKNKLPVGQGLSFNMGSPLHARFDQELNSYDGLQISHYLALDDHPGFVYESWYNPPVAQALAMPGWLDTHFRNMQNYNRMLGVGVLVGTESNAHLVPALLTRGPDIVFQPTPGDLNKLVDALTILGEIFFAGGAQEVYASTRNYQSYRNQAAIYSAQSEIDRLRELVKHDYDILLGTGHPQGGNAIGTSPTNSVVGPDFKVFGYDNLYVCDASVFPTSTTVNPQLTVMTLAHYAAACIDA